MGQIVCCGSSSQKDIRQPELTNAFAGQGESLKDTVQDQPQPKCVIDVPCKLEDRDKEFRNHTEHGNALDIQTLNSLSIVPNDKISEQLPMRQQIPQINKNNLQRIVNRRMTTQGLQAKESANEKTITHKRTSYRISGTIVAPQSKLCRQPSLSQISVDARNTMQKIFRKQDIFANIRNHSQRRDTKTQTLLLPKTSVQLAMDEREPVSPLTFRKSSHKMESNKNGQDEQDHSLVDPIIKRIPFKRVTCSSIVTINKDILHPRPVLRKAESTVLPRLNCLPFGELSGQNVANERLFSPSANQRGPFSTAAHNESMIESNANTKTRDPFQTSSIRKTHRKVTFKVGEPISSEKNPLRSPCSNLNSNSVAKQEEMIAPKNILRRTDSSTSNQINCVHQPVLLSNRHANLRVNHINTSKGRQADIQCEDKQTIIDNNQANDEFVMQTLSERSLLMDMNKLGMSP